MDEAELWRRIETALQNALHGVATHSLQRVDSAAQDAVYYIDELVALLHNKEEQRND